MRLQIYLLLVLFGVGAFAAVDKIFAEESPAEATAVCQTNDDCAEAEYCSKPDGECDAEEGVCEPRPEMCIQIFAPVCGCDGETYSNSCKAASVGANVKAQGECSAEDADESSDDESREDV